MHPDPNIDPRFIENTTLQMCKASQWMMIDNALCIHNLMFTIFYSKAMENGDNRNKLAKFDMPHKI